MNLNYPLILASKSPRRKEILEKAGFIFSVQTADTEEDYPTTLAKREIAIYLAEKKARAFLNTVKDEIVITADTTVIIDNEILEKPKDAQEAKSMLKKLSAKRHEVVTGVAILKDGKISSFSDTTFVYFNEMSDAVIADYILNHQPFDKAGSYGIQEGIGLTHIERLEGSYFTVMGLPIHKIYQALKPHIRW